MPRKLTPIYRNRRSIGVFAAEFKDTRMCTVKDVMTRNVKIIGPDQNLREAALAPQGAMSVAAE